MIISKFLLFFSVLGAFLRVSVRKNLQLPAVNQLRHKIHTKIAQLNKQLNQTLILSRRTMAKNNVDLK